MLQFPTFCLSVPTHSSKIPGDPPHSGVHITCQAGVSGEHRKKTSFTTVSNKVSLYLNVRKHNHSNAAVIVP